MTDKEQPTTTQSEPSSDPGAPGGGSSPTPANPGVTSTGLPTDPTQTPPSQEQHVLSQTPAPVPEPHVANANTDVEARDPQVTALKAIFPDYDNAILQSVLQSVGGDQDRAIDVLLGMSDPDFRSEAPPPPPEPQLTQEELDEQFARRLLFEEQQQQQRWQMQQQQQYRPSGPPRQSSRTQGTPQHANSPPSQSGGGRDTVTDFQEQFSKIAESGKKTFGAIVSKVKAKIQEFDKPAQDSGGSGVHPSWSSSNAAAYYDPNATHPPPSQTNYQPYHGQHPQAGFQSPPTTGPATTVVQQQPAFYDPDPTPVSSPPTQYTSTSSPGAKGPTQASPPVEGYDVTPIDVSQHTHSASGASSSSAVPPTGTPSSPPRGPSPANPIDGGKLGLLPKRPISLIRDPPQTQTQEPQRRRTEDDDGLEYAESPFEDPRK